MSAGWSVSNAFVKRFTRRTYYLPPWSCFTYSVALKGSFKWKFFLFCCLDAAQLPERIFLFFSTIENKNARWTAFTLSPRRFYFGRNTIVKENGFFSQNWQRELRHFFFIIAWTMRDFISWLHFAFDFFFLNLRERPLRWYQTFSILFSRMKGIFEAYYFLMSFAFDQKKNIIHD